MTADKIRWIADGEKYALVTLTVKTEGHVPEGQITPNLWVIADTKFEFPAHWREWLGTLRAGEVKSANLFLLSKEPSAVPSVLDAENKLLQHWVQLFYAGLLFTSRFATAREPVVLTGSRENGEVGLRQQSDLESPVPCPFRYYIPITATDIETAARLAGKIREMEEAPLLGGHWRFFRVLHLYQETRTAQDILERLHQYSRCIDGLVLPSPGKTKQQFKGRTQLFIGPKHHDLMGEIYDVRSAVEHLHENRYLGEFDRNVRLDLLKKEAVIEYIARTSISRIIDNKALWPHFANTTALAAFWSLSEIDRRAQWGNPIDAFEPMANFDPKHINDAELGGSSE